MDRRCIIVCDSGIGGLSLLRKLENRLKGQTLLYYADFKNLPYGNKGREELYKIAKENCKKFLSFSPKMIVFACNTLSVNTVDRLELCSVATFRVLPKVRHAEKGLLICTESTAKSNYVKRLAKNNPLLDVMPMQGLAEEIESWVSDGLEIDLEKRFQGVDGDYKFVSLGCTHYSFLENKLKKIFPNAEFLNGENDVFEKIVLNVTTFDTLDHCNEVCFIGSGADRVKSLYNKGIFEI